ncbi:MAG: response regulator [Anaerolineae bacterium]|nr:response regulator [Anaerolineae bacterium]
MINFDLDPSLFTHNPPLVLAVDDDPNTANMLETIFKRVGFQVVKASNGNAALAQAQALLPDLILLDYMMPGMNGFEVLSALRAEPTTKSIPTIIVTAQARQPEDLERGLKLGADDYLYKPFNPQELIARAQSKIKARKLEEDLERRTRELEALLGVSEQFNQTILMDELLDLIPNLALDLIPAVAGVIYLFDESGNVTGAHVQAREPLSIQTVLTDPAFVREALRWLERPAARTWTAEDALLPNFEGGMIAPLREGNNTLGLLMLIAQSPFDDHRLRLFDGIARQAALALRNAELYDVKARYASELEMRVEERTRELQSTQQLLIRQEKLASLGHLAASIAHEINNPLMPIRNLLDDLVEELEENEVKIDTKAITIIQDSLERIRKIVRQLLDFTGRRTEGPDLNFVEIGPVVDGIIDLNRKLLEQSKIKIETDMPKLPPVYGSKDQLEQVFMNLTINAQAAMPKGGKLSISGRQEDGEIVVEFEDTGVGIASEHVDRIFDPFFSTKPEGTGLGLFVTYGIIGSHNGTINVESESGGGTRFTIRLPMHDSSNEMHRGEQKQGT